MLSRLRSFLSAMTQRRHFESSLDEEVRFHLDAYADDLVRSGLPRAEAMRRARLRFGSVERAKDDCRRARGLRLGDELLAFWSDARAGIRALARTPGFSVAAVLTLALAVGINTAIYALIDAVLFRPLSGVARASELVALYTDRADTPGVEYQGVSYPDYVHYGEQVPTVALAAFLRTALTVSGPSSPTRVIGDLVSPNYFSVLGTRPAAGRLFDADTGTGDRALVIGHRFWHERFGGRPDALGRTLVVNGVSFTITGVAPPGFRGSLIDWYGDAPVDLFIPIEMLDRWRNEDAPLLHDRRFVSPQVVGRLQENATFEGASASLVLASRRLQIAYPASNAHRELIVLPATRARFWPGRYSDNVRLLVLVGAGGSVLLLLACSNLFNLWVPRVLARRREFAIRLAVGASPAALGRLLLAEVGALTTAAVVGGVGIASGLLHALGAYPAPFGVPLHVELGLDARTIFFSCGLAAVAATAIALAQVACSTRQPASTLRSAPGDSGSRAAVRGRRLLVVAQVALSVVVLAAAGSLGRSLYHLSRVDPGYEADHVLVVPIDVRDPAADQPRNDLFFRDLLRRLERIPGVESASLSHVGPLSRLRGTVSVTSRNGSGEPDPLPVIFRDVGPNYFETIGLRLLRGETFPDDATASDAVVINEALADRLWPDRDAVGRFMDIEGEVSGRRVIGVVRNAAHRDLWNTEEPYLYRPMSMRGVTGETVLVRARSAGVGAGDRIREVIAGASSRIVVLGVSTVEEDIRAHLSRQRLAAAVSTTLGVVAVVFVAVGIFGLMSITVAQHTREFGIRLAFGAGRAHIAGLVFRRAAVLSTVGSLLGAALWWWLHPVVAQEIYGFDSGAPAVVAIVGAAVLALGLAAAVHPARRAAGAEPLAALKSD